MELLSRQYLALVAPLVILLAGSSGFSQEAPQSDTQSKEAKAETSDEIGERYFVYPGREFGSGGWMPDGEIPLAQSLQCKTGKPYTGSFFYRAKCDLGRSYPYMAVAFLPGGKFEPIKKINVINKLGGVADDEHVVLRLYARSPNEAQVQFKVGGYDEDTVDLAVFTKWYKLGREWERISVDLSDQDLTGLRGALTWVVDRDHNGEKVVEFHLDDVYFVKVKNKAK